MGLGLLAIASLYFILILKLRGMNKETNVVQAFLPAVYGETT
jgi:hypothetical protein